MSIVVKEFESKRIRVREGDRYVSGTDMAKASGKFFADWRRLKSTVEHLKACESVIGIPIDRLIQINESQGTNDTRGTWLHPKVAIQFAQWCSPAFALQIAYWLEEVSYNAMWTNFSQQPGKTKDSSGFIYLVHSSQTSYYKIGKSKDCYQRLQQLQVGSPIVLVVLERFFSIDAIALEKELHEYYQAYWIRGEWFDFSPEIVREFITVANELDKTLESESALLHNNNTLNQG